MLKILYLGNKGSELGGSLNTIEVLSLKLQLYGSVYTYSGKKNKIVRLLDLVLSIFRHRKSVGYVLIDTYSTNAFWYAWVCAIVCRQLKMPYIPILHGGNLPKRLRNAPRMSAAVFGHAYINVAPSAFLQSVFTKSGFHTTFIPNFIEIENYPFRLRAHLQPRLLWVRSFDKMYHPEMALQVLALLLRDFPEAQLCMVGPEKDGSQAHCRQLVQYLGIAARVTFTDRLTRTEWVARSSDFDVFLNTAQVDNTPVSIMEALALGLPVVSTNAGGIPYLIENEEDGLLSPARDVEKMAQNITKLLTIPSLAEKLSRNGRQKMQGFDWSMVVQQWLDLLQ